MNEQEKLFELILWTDTTTVALRRLLPEEEYRKYRAKHYENMNFISATGLSDEYYDYMFEHHIKPSLEEQNQDREGKSNG